MGKVEGRGRECEGGGGDLKDYLWKVDFGGEFSSTKIKYLLKATVEYS